MREPSFRGSQARLFSRATGARAFASLRCGTGLLVYALKSSGRRIELSDAGTLAAIDAAAVGHSADAVGR